MTIGEVIRAVEGPTELDCCFETDDEMRAKCHLSSKCVTAAMWRDISFRVDEVLNSVTLADFSLKGEALGVKRNADANFSYII